MERYLIVLLICIQIFCADCEDFDIFVFAQQWPESVCIGSKLTHEHKCVIDPQVNTWTVHGLWPTKLKENPPGPNFCNKSAKFDESAVKPLMPRLQQYWPNLYKEESNDSLWEHEWIKHGTCAMVLEDLNSEYKYFDSTLSLNRNPQFDILTRLKQNGIMPSKTQTYPYTSVLKALGDVILQCYYDKAKKIQYLSQVEMCISKDLQHQISCNASHKATRNRRSLDRLTFSQPTQDLATFDLSTSFSRRSKVLSHRPGLENCYDTEEIAFPILHN